MQIRTLTNGMRMADKFDRNYNLPRGHTIEIGDYRKKISDQLRRHHVKTLPSNTASDLSVSIIPGNRLRVSFQTAYDLTPDDEITLWLLIKGVI